MGSRSRYLRLTWLGKESNAVVFAPALGASDLCEMEIVANATGLKPDIPSFHAPVARLVEVPNFFCPSKMGGLLSGEGKLDIFNCLRRGDES